MIFQILKDNKVMFWTEQESCVPSEEDIKEMKKAGYKVRRKDSKNNEKSGK